MVRPLIGAVVAVALLTTACSTTSKGTPLAVPSASTSTSVKSASSPAATSTAPKTSATAAGDDAKKIGKAQTIKDGKDSAVITLISVQSTTKSDVGIKPKSGNYVVFLLKIECKSGTISTNSLYAQLKTPDGKMIDGTEGNAFMNTVDPDLPLKDIGPGESVEGTVVLDTQVPAGSKLVWLDPLDKPLAEWAL